MQFLFDLFVLDTENFTLSHNSEVIHGEPQVIELVIFLIRNRGRVISRDELNQNIWNGRIVSDAAISSSVKMARRLLGDDGRQQRYIKTVSKKGFSFVAEVYEKKSTDFNDTFDNIDSISKDKRPSIVVQTFTNLSNKPDWNYLSEGMTEDIVTTLSKISTLIVLSYSSLSNERVSSIENNQMGRKLGADYVLSGSIQSEGNRLRISSHLVEMQSGEHVWGQSYNYEDKDIFNIQDDLTKEVVSALQVELTEGDQALLVSRGTDNIKAWRLTLEGQASILTHTQDSVRRGLQQLEQAVELDKNFSLAWAALGTAHWKQSVNEGWSRSKKTSLEKSLEANNQAMTLDPNDAATLAMRSLIFVSQRRFDEAMAIAEKALLYANTDANSIAIACIAFRACCEPELAIKHTRKAMRFCPIYPAWYSYGISLCLWMQGKLDQAIVMAEEAISIDPKCHLYPFALAIIYAEMGDIKKAKEASTAVLRIDPQFSWRTYADGMPYKDNEIETRREEALIKTGMV